MFFKKSSRTIADTHNSNNKISGKNNTITLFRGSEPLFKAFDVYTPVYDYTSENKLGKITSMCVDSQYIYCSFYDDVEKVTHIEKINSQSKLVEKTITVGNKITCCDIDEQASIIVFGTEDGKVLVFENGPVEYPMYELLDNSGVVTAVCIKGDRVVAGSSDGSFVVYSTTTSAKLYDGKYFDLQITSIGITDYCDAAIISYANGYIAIEDLDSNKSSYTIKMHESEILKSVVFSNTKAISLSEDKFILWDISSGNVSQVIENENTIEDFCVLDTGKISVVYSDGSATLYIENSSLLNKSKADIVVPSNYNLAYMFDGKYIVSKKKLCSDENSGIKSMNDSSNQFLFFYLNETGNEEVHVSEDNSDFCIFNVKNKNTSKPEITKHNENLNKLKYSLERANLFVGDIVSTFFVKDMRSIYRKSLKVESFEENIFYKNSSTNKNTSLFFRELASEIMLGIQKNSSYEQIEYIFNLYLKDLDFFIEYKDLFINMNFENITPDKKASILWNIDMLIFYINNELKKMDYKYISFISKPEIEIFNNDTLVLKKVDKNALKYVAIFYSLSGVKIKEKELNGPYSNMIQFADIKENLSPGKYNVAVVGFYNKTFSEFSDKITLEV